MVIELEPAQLAAYATTLRARAEERRRMREERRQRAWALARQAAAILREAYGADDVRVFGSLLEAEHFTEHSDIDMAVSGLDPMTHLEALGRLLSLSAEFEFDLVDVQRCPRSLRDTVERTGARL